MNLEHSKSFTNKKLWQLMLLGCSILFVTPAVLAQDNEINLGILNTVGDETENHFYKATEKALRKAFSPQKLTIKTYDLPGLEKAIKNKEINFFICNPGFFAFNTAKYDISIVASQLYPGFKSPDYSLASTVVVPSSNKEIYSLNQLQGKSVCVVAPNAFGGRYIAHGELLKKGYDPEKFFGDVVFTGYPMPNVFKELKEGKCDAGIVRACLLEDMISRGQLASTQFRVVEPKNAPTKQNCLASSDWYPGWVFAFTSNTPNDIAKECAKVLFNMPSVDGYSWTLPSNLNNVDSLFKNLRVEHYAYLRDWNWNQWLRQHFELVFSVVFLIVFLACYLRILKRQVRKKTIKLERALYEKEREHKQAEQIKQTLNDLEKVSLAGMLSSMMAHELKQPLAVIRNYSEALKSIWLEKNQENPEICEVLDTLQSESARASRIIEHIRGLVKGKNIKAQNINVKEFLEVVAKRFIQLGGEIIPSIKLQDQNLWISIDPIQLELVLLNLLNNSRDAIKSQGMKNKIDISVVEKNDGVCIFVTNPGRIVNPQAIKDIFNVKASNKSSGLGLGLAISARIIEANGGSLELEQKKEEVTACITLPKVYYPQASHN